MIDLKHPKWEDFHISDMPKREATPGVKVHCGIYRRKPGSPRPHYQLHNSISIPKEMFDGHLHSPRIVEALGLQSNGKETFMGIGGDQESDTYLVHIGLPMAN